MADRLCRGCAGVLEDVGPRCRCPACAAPASTWLVASSGAIVAAATEREVMPGAELVGALRYAAGPSWSGG